MLLTVKMILVFVLVFIAWVTVEIVIRRIITLVKEKCFSRKRCKGNEEAADSFEEIDITLDDLESALKNVRMAVAQAIATERQLEQQLEKNVQQAATWDSRAAMALQQNNPTLAEQAYQRKEQYSKAATQLEEQLEKSRNIANPLRQGLTDLESDFRQLHTRKELLKARNQSAEAYIKFNKHFAALLATYAIAQNKLVEEKLHGIIDEMPAGLMVVNREAQILAVNPQIEAMTGIRADDMCHKISADTIFMQSNEESLSSRIKDLAGNGIYSTNVRTSDEGWTPADITISRIKSGDFIICVLDATTRTRL
jgi:PAS domain S-box-containing protein